MFLLLTLIGSIGLCFAKPCTPEYWSLVKAGSVPAPAPKSARGSRGSMPGSTRGLDPDLDGDFAAAPA